MKGLSDQVIRKSKFSQKCLFIAFLNYFKAEGLLKAAHLGTMILCTFFQGAVLSLPCPEDMDFGYRNPVPDFTNNR